MDGSGELCFLIFYFECSIYLLAIASAWLGVDRASSIKGTHTE